MSEIKVNKLSPRTNCGTVQLGDSGDTITIPAGATITNNGTAAGFGATGAASWDTTVKTTGFTAVSGVGYFVDTTSGAISVNLPAGTAGDVVAIKDYANTFDTNAVTLVQNGSDKIGGSTVNATLSTEGLAVTLVYVDATQGWLVTDNGTQDTAPTAQYVTATGGTITCCGDYKIHTFTGPGTFTVCSVGNAAGSNTVEYIVVAGGGGGGKNQGGGGGAGGLRDNFPSPVCGGLSVTATGFPITVGGGGPADPGNSAPGVNGSNSVFSTITSAGGGGGGWDCAGGNAGGSGGGAGTIQTGGAGNTPSTPCTQGTAGGTSTHPNGAGGGGGKGAVGGAGSSDTAGSGGIGKNFPALIAGSSGTSGPAPGQYFAGGGGGSAHAPGGTHGSGGSGGGGQGGGTSNPGCTTAGTTNTGGGGGGNGNNDSSAGAGGSGIVIIRYKFQ